MPTSSTSQLLLLHGYMSATKNHTNSGRYIPTHLAHTTQSQCSSQPHSQTRREEENDNKCVNKLYNLPTITKTMVSSPLVYSSHSVITLPQQPLTHLPPSYHSYATSLGKCPAHHHRVHTILRYGMNTDVANPLILRDAAAIALFYDEAAWATLLPPGLSLHYLFLSYLLPGPKLQCVSWVQSHWCVWRCFHSCPVHSRDPGARGAA